MIERPILFSGPMVRAIIDGKKTQTRRIAKLTDGGHLKEVGGNRRWHSDDQNARLACPYGQPGDRLWVRETWAGPLIPAERWLVAKGVRAFERPGFCEYAADGGPAPEYMDADDRLVCRWTPSIHMPRWASRILLEIVSVRVERLQDIKPDDCIAEGAWPIEKREIGRGHEAIDAFATLWVRINGPDSWHANPWVWVIEFEGLCHD